MKKLLIALGIVAVLVGGVAAAGAMMPREHESTRSVRLDASPEEVFAALVDVEQYPSWRSDVSRVEVRRTAPLAFVEHGENGDLPMVLDDVEAPRRLVVRIDDPELPFGGSWTYAVAPDGTGARVTITERGFVDNVLMRFFATLLMDPAESQTRYLEDLGRRFGQEVAPTP